MKKYILLIISFIILIITIIGVSVSIVMKNNLESEIKDLNQDIEEKELLIENSSSDKEKLEKEYNDLKEELKDKVEEYSIWENLKEKITK